MKSLPRDYVAYLNHLVDEIFEKATEYWDWETNTELLQWAGEARLHPTTIWRLGTRETRVPQLLTMYKLAKSVGWSLDIKKSNRPKLKRHAA